MRDVSPGGLPRSVQSRVLVSVAESLTYTERMMALRWAIVTVILAPVLAGQGKQDQAKQGPSGAYQQAARIPARIVDFKATPASIQPGQAAMLVWSVENPTSVTIDPEPGNVT